MKVGYMRLLDWFFDNHPVAILGRIRELINAIGSTENIFLRAGDKVVLVFSLHLIALLFFIGVIIAV